MNPITADLIINALSGMDAAALARLAAEMTQRSTGDGSVQNARLGCIASHLLDAARNLHGMRL
jgi:hypothetical protein